MLEVVPTEIPSTRKNARVLAIVLMPYGLCTGKKLRTVMKLK